VLAKSGLAAATSHAKNPRNFLSAHARAQAKNLLVSFKSLHSISRHLRSARRPVVVWLAIPIDPSVHPWPAIIQHLQVVQARNRHVDYYNATGLWNCCYSIHVYWCAVFSESCEERASILEGTTMADQVADVPSLDHLY
jgi:hypothetical protein